MIAGFKSSQLRRGQAEQKMSDDKKILFMAMWRIIAPDEIEPVPDYRFDAVRKWKFDWAFIDARIAVEVDGGNRMARIITTNRGNQKAVAVGRHTKDADLDKCNTATMQGWRVFHFSPKMLEDNPDRCVNQVRELLNKFGV